MNAEFVKALLAAGPEIHAVGLVINLGERSSFNTQSMIGLLHELKIDLKHVVVIFTHGDTLPNNPGKMEKRCTMRREQLLQHIAKLQCMVRLLAHVKRRFLVVENQQPCERDTIAFQLFGCIDSIAADPMINDTFRNSLHLLIEQTESETVQVTDDNEALNKQLRRVNEDESVLHEQENTLEALKGKVIQKFDEKKRSYIDACTGVISNRDEGITTLEKAAAEIDKVMKNATIAKISGFSAGVAGGAVFTVGTGLLLGGVTAPAGIPLMVIGGALGGAGTVTAIGGSIGQFVERSKNLKCAKNWLKVNKTKCQELINAHEGLTKEHDHIAELFPSINAELPRGITQVGEIVNTWKDIAQHSAKDAAVLVARAAGSGLGIAQGVLEGIDISAEVAALGAKTAAKAAGGVAIGLSGLVMIIDLGFLIKSSYDLHKLRKGNPTKLSKTLMELAEAVRKENNLLREANCNARSGSTDGPIYNGSGIGNPFVGNEEHPLNSLEPTSTSEVECQTMGDAHSSGTQEIYWSFDGGDMPMIFLAEEAGEGPSILTMQQNPDNVSTLQLIIQADGDTESDTDA